ncbi:MAG: AraC family transcriptional regulator [Clostridia bacterium]|nr:AraC family transcriptional regulator [Clostridia bacterium]
MIEFKSKDLLPADCDIQVSQTVRKVHFKEHKHDFVEFVYILSGNYTQYVDGVPFEVQKGDLIYIGPGETHAFSSNEEVSAYDIYVRPELIYNKLLSDQPTDLLALSLCREFSAEISNIAPCVSFQGADLIEIESLLNAMQNECNQNTPGKNLVLTGYFTVLITKFLREIRKKQMYMFDRQLQKIMPEILQYIEENYRKPLSLEELAEKSFYNPSYFSRIFKELYGKTLTEYIAEKRIMEAVKLLENTELSIEEICHAVGYGDKKHFYKMFKAKMELTPGQYRRETVQNNQ